MWSTYCINHQVKKFCLLIVVWLIFIKHHPNSVFLYYLDIISFLQLTNMLPNNLRHLICTRSHYAQRKLFLSTKVREAKRKEMIDKFLRVITNFNMIFPCTYLELTTIIIQSWTFAYVGLLNKPCVNWVTLREQNQSLKNAGM